jgi:hypothetical protein
VVVRDLPGRAPQDLTAIARTCRIAARDDPAEAVYLHGMGTFDRRRGQDERDPGHARLRRLTVVLSVLAVVVTAAVMVAVISADVSRRRPAPSPHPDTASATPEALSAPVARHLVYEARLEATGTPSAR